MVMRITTKLDKKGIVMLIISGALLAGSATNFAIEVGVARSQNETTEVYRETERFLEDRSGKQSAIP